MRKIFLFITILLTTLTLRAQDIASLFVEMPRDILFVLTDNNRKDMVDLYVNGKEAEVLNAMRGDSKLIQLNENYIKLQLTTQNTVEIKLLPLINKTQIICVVQTACAPVCDSQISFYTTQWEPIENKGLVKPFTFQDFLNTTGIDTEKRKNALTSLDTHFFRYQLSPDDNNLSIFYTAPEYLGIEERKAIEPYLTQKPLVQHWNNTRFQ